jgi:UDP-N-acetylglucosamine 3-dehydrogenase
MIRVGVIGVGNIGRHHARIYSGLPGARLCAVADPEESRAQVVAARYGCRAFRDYREMLERESLDAVSIAAPTRDHFTIAETVIEAGVDLLVEKPLAVTLAEAKALVAKAQGAQVKLAVGHVERFNPAVQELKRRMDVGELGAISSVIAKRVGVMPPQVKDANVIIDLAVHDIDILNYFFGAMPMEVSAMAGRALLSDRYDHAEIFLKYPADRAGGGSAAGCFVQVNWITPLKIRTLSVTGNSGHAELNYVTQKLEIYQSNVEREYDDFGDFVVRFGEAEKSVVAIDVREPLRAELEDFVDSVANDRAPKVRGEDGVRALLVAEQAISAL